MANTLEQYRQAKQDIEKLHGAAKKELIARFNELAHELLAVQKELKDEFGLKLTVPLKPKTRLAKTAAASPKEAAQPARSSREIDALERKITTQKRKLEEAAKAGKPEKLIKDRIYELEDELRLAKDRP